MFNETSLSFDGEKQSSRRSTEKPFGLFFSHRWPFFHRKNYLKDARNRKFGRFKNRPVNSLPTCQNYQVLGNRPQDFEGENRIKNENPFLLLSLPSLVPRSGFYRYGRPQGKRFPTLFEKHLKNSNFDRDHL